jgi:hypothetical protein
MRATNTDNECETWHYGLLGSDAVYPDPLYSSFFFKRSQIQWNLGSRTPLITNKSVHEQIFRKKKSRVTNGVSSNEHASRQQWLATSWEYRRESVSYYVTFAQYTSAVPSLEFHCDSLYEHFGWRTASRNLLNSWTEVPLYPPLCVVINETFRITACYRSAHSPEPRIPFTTSVIILSPRLTFLSRRQKYYVPPTRRHSSSKPHDVASQKNRNIDSKLRQIQRTDNELLTLTRNSHRLHSGDNRNEWHPQFYESDDDADIWTHMLLECFHLTYLNIIRYYLSPET